MKRKDLLTEIVLLCRSLNSLAVLCIGWISQKQKPPPEEPETPLQVILSDLDGNTVAALLRTSNYFTPMSGHATVGFDQQRPLFGFVLHLVQGSFGFCAIRSVRVGTQNYVLSPHHGGAARFQHSGGVDPSCKIVAELVLEFPK